MLHRFIVAIGAGCAAALLFVGGRAVERLGDGARLSGAVADHDRDAGLGRRRRRDRGRDFGRRPRPVRCAGAGRRASVRLLLFAVSVAAPAWGLAAFAITPVARYFGAQRPEAPVHPSVGAIVSLASLIGILASAAVLTTVSRLRGLPRRRAPSRGGHRRPYRRRPSRARRMACPLARLPRRWCDLCLWPSPPRRC